MRPVALNGNSLGHKEKNHRRDAYATATIFTGLAARDKIETLASISPPSNVDSKIHISRVPERPSQIHEAAPRNRIRLYAFRCAIRIDCRSRSSRRAEASNRISTRL